MPVPDRPIHPSTQQGEDFRYGCWNRPDRFKPSYWAPNRRYYPDGSFDVVSVRVPHGTGHACPSDGENGLGRADQGCLGCRHIVRSSK